MDRNRNIKEQDELVNRITKNEAAGDHLNDIDSLINEHNLLNDQFSSEVVSGAIRISSPVEDENAAQVSNYSIKPMTSLHIAALQGHVDVVQNLIHHGADVHAEDKHGCTALRIAAQKGDYDCLKVLIEAGTDAFASIRMKCKTAAFRMLGASALIIAVQHNHLDCVYKLLQYGVDANALDENGRSFLYIVADKAINDCLPAFLEINNHSVSIGASFIPIRFNLNIIQCARKLMRIKSLYNEIKRNGFAELCKLASTSLEDYDAEIFKVFVLETYCFDCYIPRGLAALRHFGFEYYNSKIAAILITHFSDVVITEEILDMNLFEYLLRISGKFETFKFVAKCVPWVPHINSLTTLPFTNKLSSHQFYGENLENFVLPPNVAFELEYDQTCIYVAMHDREKELAELKLMWSNIVRGMPKYGRYPLNESLINLIDERISDEIDQLNLIIRNEMHANVNDCTKYYYRLQLWHLKKYLWCEKVASNPPTLLQCCRYSLLKCLGPLNMESIRKLPLPYNLQSYLLFQ